jgi:hypothetical protein
VNGNSSAEGDFANRVAFFTFIDQGLTDVADYFRDCEVFRAPNRGDLGTFA